MRGAEVQPVGPRGLPARLRAPAAGPEAGDGTGGLGGGGYSIV